MAESTFRLTEKESLTVERLSYIYESNKAVATILSRELADAENPDAKEMLREVCNSCRASFLEMRVAQDTVLSSRIDDFYSKRVEFAFDFKAQEVRCKWCLGAKIIPTLSTDFLTTETLAWKPVEMSLFR